MVARSMKSDVVCIEVVIEVVIDALNVCCELLCT